METGLQYINKKNCKIASKRFDGTFNEDTEVCAIGAFQVKLSRILATQIENGFKFTTLENGTLSRTQYGGR